MHRSRNAEVVLTHPALGQPWHRKALQTQMTCASQAVTGSDSSQAACCLQPGHSTSSVLGQVQSMTSLTAEPARPNLAAIKCKRSLLLDSKHFSSFFGHSDLTLLGGKEEAGR